MLDYGTNGTWTDLETDEQKQVCYLVMEPIGGGEVIDLLIETGKLPYPIARRIFREMLEGVQHIHSKGKGHCDLKLENTLFRDNHHVVIIDMGFVQELEGEDRSGTLRTIQGTEGYMAPEMFVSSGARYKAINSYFE